MRRVRRLLRLYVSHASFNARLVAHIGPNRARRLRP